ncbi:Fe(3+) ABC transporter substrate-binding protein [Phaeovulum sp. W22_SRMD_FR3]|uniref:Fe(3+) ABC transporter substrate-binding protein n=1 Tax=Phaeovulum sp. W22_SRMD_FR3 TaxID=3240274 RepID=UPI003F9BCFB7
MLRALLATTLLAAPLLTSAAVAEEVNVYSHRQPELVQPLLDAFTAKTGIAVNVAFVDSGMVERLVAEGDRSPADLVMTVDIARLEQVVQAGVTQAVDDPALTAAIPAAFRDPANQWFGLTTRARIVYASKAAVADGDVTSYEDLADPKWKGRICTRSFTNDYNVALTAAYLKHHGEEATRDWLLGVKANLAKKPEGNDRSQVKSIWSGECDISLGNTYYMGQMLADPEQKEYADSVRIVFPVFEDAAGNPTGTHMNVSGVAMTKAAPNKDAALKLMEFLVSDEAQHIYAETNNEFPVKPGVEASELVKSWGSFTPDTLTLTDVAELRPAALKLIEEVNFDG